MADAEAVIEQIQNMPQEEQRKVRDFLNTNTGTNGAGESDKPKAPIAGLHPGAMEMSPDFDEPLPDEFWLGKE